MHKSALSNFCSLNVKCSLKVRVTVFGTWYLLTTFRMIWEGKKFFFNNYLFSLFSKTLTPLNFQ